MSCMQVTGSCKCGRGEEKGAFRKGRRGTRRVGAASYRNAVWSIEDAAANYPTHKNGPGWPDRIDPFYKTNQERQEHHGIM